MRAHAYDFSEESLAVCNQNVHEYLEQVDTTEIEKQRDELLVVLLKAKSDVSALV